MTRSPRSPRQRRVLRVRGQPGRRRPATDFACPQPIATPGDEVQDGPLSELVAENLTLARELARVQQRASLWRDEVVARIDRLEAQLMRAHAQRIAKDTLLAVQRESLDALRKRAAIWLTNEELLRQPSDLRARNRSLEGELARSRDVIDTPATAPRVAPPAANDAGTPVAAGKVLCVGGRTRQLPLYRELVERGGGCFAHASGAVDDDLDALGTLLDGADLVILQAGYVSRGACRVIEAHCLRTGKPCMLLDKPCAQAFARSLARARDAAAS